MSPVIGGDLVSSALPVGVFEWWVENPGPDPLTIGIMLTWQDPAADPDEPAPPGAWHESIESARAGGAILHASAGAPSGLRGTFALAAARERPADAPTRYDPRRPWSADRDKPGLALEAGRPRDIALAPFEVLTLEAKV